jgi:hypothetical protein
MKSGMYDTDALPKLFQGDCILPSQYYDFGPRRYSDEGHRRLLLAVLEDAIRCYFTYSGAPRGSDRYAQFSEARDWIYSTEESSGFTFAKVCEPLEIDPEWLRDGLRRRFAAISSQGAQAIRNPTGGDRPASTFSRLSLRERNGRMRVVSVRP